MVCGENGKRNGRAQTTGITAGTSASVATYPPALPDAGRGVPVLQPVGRFTRRRRGAIIAPMALYQAVPTLGAELSAWRRGYRNVAGVDEAGCGPLAGPVVAGAVILDPNLARVWWSDLRDSKMLTAPEREHLAAMIRSECAWGAGIATHQYIDTHGLTAARKFAMRQAVEQLPCRPDMLLIDAMSLPAYRHRSIIHGDALVASIAAGSIIAKVTRDAIMADYHPAYPQYGFDRNVGYATPEHKRALVEHGPCEIHRRLFAPVRAACVAHGVFLQPRFLTANAQLDDDDDNEMDIESDAELEAAIAG